MEIQGLGVSTNPFINEKSKLHHIIMKILKSYQVKNPLVKRDSPITLLMLWFIKKKASSERDWFILKLMIGVYFFAMRSYKYSKTPGEPRSTIITSNNISFFKQIDNRISSCSFTDSSASSLQIIFQIQKNLEFDEPVSNYRIGKDLCPICSWQYILCTLYS